MNTISVIYTQEVLNKNFNMYGDLENPLFLAKDVAEWIDYSKRSDGSYQVGQMLKTVDEDEKISTVNNLNGKEMWFLTEASSRVSDYFIESTYKVPGNF